MAESDADATGRPDRLLVWGFGTLDVALLTLLPALAAHLTGSLAGLLAGLSTTLGALAFGVLWALAILAVRWTLSRAPLDGGLGRLALHAFAAGGAAGAAVGLGLGVAAVARSVLRGSPVPEFLLLGVIVGAVGTLVGGLIGLLAGAVNLAAYRTAGLIGPSGAGEASDAPAAAGEE